MPVGQRPSVSYASALRNNESLKRYLGLQLDPCNGLRLVYGDECPTGHDDVHLSDICALMRRICHGTPINSIGNNDLPKFMLAFRAWEGVVGKQFTASLSKWINSTCIDYDLIDHVISHTEDKDFKLNGDGLFSWDHDDIMDFKIKVLRYTVIDMYVEYLKNTDVEVSVNVGPRFVTGKFHFNGPSGMGKDYDLLCKGLISGNLYDPKFVSSVLGQSTNLNHYVTNYFHQYHVIKSSLLDKYDNSDKVRKEFSDKTDKLRHSNSHNGKTNVKVDNLRGKFLVYSLARLHKDMINTITTLLDGSRSTKPCFLCYYLIALFSDGVMYSVSTLKHDRTDNSESLLSTGYKLISYLINILRVDGRFPYDKNRPAMVIILSDLAKSILLTSLVGRTTAVVNTTIRLISGQYVIEHTPENLAKLKYSILMHHMRYSLEGLSCIRIVSNPGPQCENVYTIPMPRLAVHNVDIMHSLSFRAVFNEPQTGPKGGMEILFNLDRNTTLSIDHFAIHNGAIPALREYIKSKGLSDGLDVRVSRTGMTMSFFPKSQKLTAADGLRMTSVLQADVNAGIVSDKLCPVVGQMIADANRNVTGNIRMHVLLKINNLFVFSRPLIIEIKPAVRDARPKFIHDEFSPIRIIAFTPADESTNPDEMSIF